MKHFESVDAYIDSFDGQTKERLNKMRALIKDELPESEERISYNIPAYFFDGKLIVYFAGYASHIGMYPGRTNSKAYNDLAEKYAHGKSTARFVHSEPLPKAIIKKFIKLRLAEV